MLQTQCKHKSKRNRNITNTDRQIHFTKNISTPQSTNTMHSHIQTKTNTHITNTDRHPQFNKQIKNRTKTSTESPQSSQTELIASTFPNKTQTPGHTSFHQKKITNQTKTSPETPQSSHTEPPKHRTQCKHESKHRSATTSPRKILQPNRNPTQSTQRQCKKPARRRRRSSRSKPLGLLMSFLALKAIANGRRDDLHRRSAVALPSTAEHGRIGGARKAPGGTGATKSTPSKQWLVLI